MNLWSLPRQAEFGGEIYSLHADFRDILEILGWLDREELPPAIRWRVAMGLFYEPELAPAHYAQGAAYLADFIRAGEEDRPGPKLLDWEQDAPAIISDINRVAGREIRDVPFVHWWTFLAWFAAIGQGQLSTLICIRDKRRRGKKLEAWEEEFYRQNKNRVDLKPRYTAEELAEQARLLAMLDGKSSERSCRGGL